MISPLPAPSADVMIAIRQQSSQKTGRVMSSALQLKQCFPFGIGVSTIASPTVVLQIQKDVRAFA